MADETNLAKLTEQIKTLEERVSELNDLQLISKLDIINLKSELDKLNISGPQTASKPVQAPTGPLSCRKCGTMLPEEAKFCRKCGEKVK